MRFVQKALAATLASALVAGSALAADPAPADKPAVQIDKQKVSIMVGMDMGFNRYDLHRDGDGGFVAQATLPVCVTGGHAWTLFLELDGTRYSLDFHTG